MTVFITAVMLVLLARDPLGFTQIQGFQHMVVERSPLMFQGQRVQALAYFENRPRIEFDYQLLFEPQYNFTPDERLQWGACTLVHEGVHLTRWSHSEVEPMLYQYVCLDRLGAPQRLKDYIYHYLVELHQPVDNGRGE